MGLEEKRRIAEFQSETLPKIKADLKSVIKTDVPYEVDWNSFSNDLNALKCLEDQLQELNNAFRGAVGYNAGGSAYETATQSVKEGLKKIVVKNAGSAAQKGITLAGGALELRTACGIDGGRLLDTEMKPVIEAGL